jgi:hypothetical protein
MYHTVFYITDRYPDAIIGVVALVSIVPIAALSLRELWRDILRRTSWVWLSWAGILWLFLNVHATGWLHGTVVGVVGAGITLWLAWLVWGDREMQLRDGRRVRTRPIAPIVATVALIITGLMGSRYLGAFDLAHQDGEGGSVVVVGVVEDAGSAKPEYECFSVGQHRYCYGEFSTIGFCQIAANGGPIHDGVLVRVTSIGDVIVRLEIAGGQ